VSVSKTHLTNQSLILAKLVSFGDRKGSAEAASMLPQAAALRPCTGFMVGWRGWRWGRGKLLQTPEHLGSPCLGIQTLTSPRPGCASSRAWCAWLPPGVSTGYCSPVAAHHHRLVHPRLLEPRQVVQAQAAVFGIPRLRCYFWRLGQAQDPILSGLSPPSAPCYIPVFSIMCAPSFVVSESRYAACLPLAVS
jgi:hypothetical protein